MKNTFAEIISQHQTRAVVNASQSHPNYKNGFYASCSCGHIGVGRGYGDEGRSAAQKDAHLHVAGELEAELNLTLN